MESIEVRRHGQHTIVMPPVPKLSEALTTDYHIPEEDDRHGIGVIRFAGPLLWDHDYLRRPCMEGLAGLESQITRFLSQQGYQVRLTGRRSKQLPSPKPTKSGGHSPDDAMLQFVQHNERGLIEVHKGVKVERLIAQIAEAFPRQKILVVATRPNDVRYLRRRLRKRGHEVGHVLDGWSSVGRYQLVVTTYVGVGNGVCEAEHRDIVLYLNPGEVFCKAGAEGLKQLHRARVFGFIPKGFCVPPPTSGLIAALFGENRVVVPRHGRTQQPVDVTFVEEESYLPERPDEEDLAVRRSQIWYNHARNRHIAIMAEAMRDEDNNKLLRLFPRLSGSLARLQGRVGILVDSLEHGVALRRHLPEWPLLAGNTADTTGLSRCDKEWIVKLGKNMPTNMIHEDCIVTTAALPKAGHFDVLIRADAGVGLPGQIDTKRIGCFGVEDRLQVVDFADKAPGPRQWARSRKAAYDEAGWTVTGGPRVTEKDRRRRPAAARQPVLPYQRPVERRWVKGPLRTSEFHYQQRRRQREQRLLREASGQITLEQIADKDFLVDCFRQLQREGGPAPGIDGISPRDISLSDFGHIAEQLAEKLHMGQWRPQQTWIVRIPKRGTNEFRELNISVVLDRVVGRALHQKLQPLWEQVFRFGSWGFRPKRSCWQMIAAMEYMMEKTGRWVLAIDDVRKAFDSCPINNVMAAHAEMAAMLTRRNKPIISDEVLDLIEIMLRGTDGDRLVGLDQGGPYCPDALNVLLHIAHDVPLDAVDGVLFWFRYADNLVYLRRSVSEGQEVLSRVRKLFSQVNLSLKGKDGIADLRAGDCAQVLGFGLRLVQGRLRIELGKDSLGNLEEHLTKAQEADDPNETAGYALRQWINAFGPAFENRELVLAEIPPLLRRLGFREIAGADELDVWMEEAHERWRVCRRRMRRQLGKRKLI